jgi:3-methylcrotonyl-CoA carboxylase alpha subunit
LNGARATRDVHLRSGEWQRTVPVRFDRPAPGGGEVHEFGGDIHVFQDGRHHRFTVSDPYLPPAESAEHHGGLVAPMPGRVLAVQAKPGDAVTRGAPLVIMEAMKMEHTVRAPRAGVIGQVFIEVGEQIKEGTELLVLADA